MIYSNMCVYNYLCFVLGARLSDWHAKRCPPGLALVSTTIDASTRPSINSIQFFLPSSSYTSPRPALHLYILLHRHSSRDAWCQPFLRHSHSLLRQHRRVDSLHSVRRPEAIVLSCQFSTYFPGTYNCRTNPPWWQWNLSHWPFVFTGEACAKARVCGGIERDLPVAVQSHMQLVQNGHSEGLSLPCSPLFASQSLSWAT